mmetsp:Transcript_12563/g.20300  ORF Transcript_12563/g.20300 Transcript_12563/m.20300 type:complete len:765 (+) Transcript_12563:405-2699(+)|eukprot:CAMPEP_0202030254 /NCGR_PEP_ID=MMETSP0905-20130828/64401_1 /ASSEMBLY_ACC=CAM_ASM_000554 /TAXON_ID=420261 /ORGANISM="Thalassiosira antarctica, Strain CCMP982" /LENGTH=764 /DNA_ID=CAMNT_0048594047 /DNA_START=150 /DNA_END=2444 /DNA_ORIENTATION=-
MARKSSTNPNAEASSASSSSSSKPKRVRRKCSAPNCSNRVVQGGVCVTHGAKRKLCSQLGCDKAVKLAGFCSTHGPARRKCDTPGCARVAVQGGKCLSHGARRRVCCYPGGKCEKNAIMGGMCKKHYDRVQDAEGMLEMSLCGVVGGGSSVGADGADGGGEVAAMAIGGESFGSGGGSGSQSLGGSSGDASVGEMSEDDGGASVFRSPSWGSAPAPTTPSATANAAFYAGGEEGMGGSWEEGMADSSFPPQATTAAMAPSMSAPNLAAIGRHHHRRANKKMKSSNKGHLRGLSIFDDMPTMDAIINSGAENQPAQGQQASPGGAGGGRVVVQSRSQPPPQPTHAPMQPIVEYPRYPQAPPPTQHQVVVQSQSQQPPQPPMQPIVEYPPRYPQAAPPATSAENDVVMTTKTYPPRYPQSSISDVTMSTKTPTPQVSFADCTTIVGGGVATQATGHSVESPRCTGNASCTCKACRSPTLAIFEQMIVASQKLESGEFDPTKFAGLSPPKLSPRKFLGSMPSSAMQQPTMTPRSANKQVSFLPEEPNSSGSVVRKVSSNNIVGEESWVDAAAREEEEGRQFLPQGVNNGIPQEYEAAALPQDDRDQRQEYFQRLRGHDHAAAAAPVNEGPASHALAAAIRDDSISRTVSHDVNDGHRYSYNNIHYQQQQLHPNQQGHPHHGHSSHYHTQALPHRHIHHHHHHTYTNTTENHSQITPPDFNPPQTPALYDADAAPMAVVSTHSMHHEQLLPKPRGNRAFEHLFIPKEV